MNRPMRDGQGHDGGVHTLKAVVLIVVLVVVGVLVLDRSKPTHSAATTAATHGHTTTTLAPTTTVPPPTTPTTLIPAAQVKVQVLNGVLTGSLASEWSTKLKTRYGYTTEPADNATAKVTASTIYILTPGYVPEALALASQVGLASSAVNTTIPAPTTAPIPTSERSTANLVLVIGPDLASSA
jgi:hypothetical protein